MIFANWIEAALVLFIIATMGYVIWRGGAANPVGTGRLDRRMSALSGKVDAVDSEVKGVVSKVGEIEDRLEDMEKLSAKVADIRRLEKRLEAYDAKMDAMREYTAAMRAENAERRALAEATAKQVDMLYQHIVAKGMGS